MTTTHIMLDIETWGTYPGCDIRSIGAVVFAPIARHGGSLVHDGSLGTIRPFYIATENPEITDIDALSHGQYCWDMKSGRRSKYLLFRDPETEKWWKDQSAEAQAAFTNPVELREACKRFGDWLNNTVMMPNDYNDEYWQPYDGIIYVWANDPHFDVSMLEAVFRAVGLPVPWHYRSPRSMRTVCDLAGMGRNDHCTYGEAHNALHDAIAQAMTVCEAYKRLGLQK